MAWGRSPGIGDLIARVKSDEAHSICVMPFRKLADGDVKDLAAALRESKKLEELIMAGHALSAADARALGEAIGANRSLRLVSVGNSALGDEAAYELVKHVGSSTTIERLDLESKGLSGEGAGRAAAAVLVPGCSLRELILSRNGLGAQGLAGLSSLGNLARLELRACGLGDQGAQQIAAVLRGGGAGLAHLDLSDNAIGTAGAAGLAESLGGCAALASLHLDSNPIGDEGLGAVLRAIQSRQDEGASTAFKLSVEGCGLGSQAGAVLAAAIEKGLNIVSLRIGQNSSLSPDAAIVLLELDRLEELDLSICPSVFGSATESPAVFRALAACGNLQRLNLNGCQLAAAGSAALAAVVSVPEAFGALKELDLSVNGLTLTDIQSILSVLEKEPFPIPNLETLVVGGNPGAQEAEAFREVAMAFAERRGGIDVAWRAADGEAGQTR